MKMELGYELDSLSELPPLPQEFDSRNYSFVSSSAITPLESLVPFPPSDFTPSTFTYYDKHDFLQLHQHSADSLFLDSTLSLLNHHYVTTESTQLQYSDVATPFLHLPDLQSFEQTTTDADMENKEPFLCLSHPPPVVRHEEKRRKTLRSLVKSTFTISPSPSPSPSSSLNSGSPVALSSPHAKSGAERRRKISDKIRSLEKLMPWEKKMEMAMVLEEAHKYIRFLQSQIASLRWMPLESVYCTAGKVEESNQLKSLTRQQILQVLVNSPGARTVLYTNGVCIFSYEQLLSIQMMTPSARNL